MVGNARYVRYIVIAFFVLAVVYFVSNASDNVTLRTPEMLGLRPSSSSSSSSSEPAQGDVKAPNDDQKSLSDSGDNTAAAGGSVGSSASSSSSSSSNSHSNSNSENAPMAMSPTDAGFYPLIEEAPGPRMNATFVTLARNSDVWEVARSIRQVEDRFNKRYHYDWVFLNDKPFDDEFKKVTSSLISGKTHYGLIPPEHWSFPDFIDQDKAKKVREEMAKKKIIYGDSVSYRHMCRFESGFFFRQELMLNYDYYWRVEPSVEYFCDIHYDPFRYIHENNKKYSFVLSLYEYAETIPTLWDSVKKFMREHPEHLVEDNSLRFLSDDDGESYNKCHFWSNFEIGNLNWLRSKAYIDFFESLDKDGGFFYERWGDAPVHSIAAGLLLQKEEIHFFNDIAYYHVPFTHCPTGEETRQQLRCHCNPKNNFDWKGYSCTSRFFDVNNLEKPEGWEKQT
ncbi:alpha-mannosyltransferase [Niveomyces insectorum RCEF 264]|uniref:Alpha-mannosyltransferase n=1 Tax=Niveomyces insectorum RCEF 264 TaxID=1081102 RepID=A0A162JBL2_9HYPO|nr:alpha-mannosyltransferase [Niveomyces insectorum RCEF 264]